MNYQQANLGLVFSIAAAALILTGCGPQIQQPLRIFPPKQTIEQSIAQLSTNTDKLQPIRARGSCLFRYTVDDKKPNRENFRVKLWFSPPKNIYLQGDVALDPTAICMGSNEEEFWFSIKPQTNTYWWGRFDEIEHCFGNYLVNPANLLEALGAVIIDEPTDWNLSKDGEFDILTKTNSRNIATKKIYVNSQDYLPRKIEYYNGLGQLKLITELDKYKKLEEGFYLPRLIKITTVEADENGDSIRIKFDSLKKREFPQKIFLRRPPKKFKTIEKLGADCQWTEQAN